MWIIPKNLHTLASVADTGALISDLNELSALSEQSLIARSNLLSAPTWLRKWKQGSSMSHLYGRILKPSRGDIFEVEWTSFQEASLASHLARQGEEQEMKTPDICGPISLEESENLDDLPLFSSKMWKESSPQNSQAPSGQTPQGHLFCSMSLGSWNEWVTGQRQDYSQRQKSVPHTNGSVYLYLAYNPVLIQKPSMLSSEEPQTLPTGKMWKTPTTTDVGREANLVTKEGQPWKGEGRAYRLDGSVKQMTLQYQVEQTEEPNYKPWATPNTMDTLPPRSPEALKRHLTNGARTGRTSSGNLREQVCVYPWETHGPQDEELHNTHGNPQESHPTLRVEKKLNCQSIGGGTPTVAEVQKISSNPLSKGQMGLNNDPMLRNLPNWGSPTTRDYKDATLTKLLMNEKYQLRQLPSQVLHIAQFQGALNPRWVETLMGLPIGWVMPSCQSPVTIVTTNLECLETESSPPPQSEPSESYGSDSSKSRLNAHPIKTNKTPKKKRQKPMNDGFMSLFEED